LRIQTEIEREMRMGMDKIQQNEKDINESSDVVINRSRVESVFEIYAENVEI
jgi:hypothetical protein